MNSNIPKSVKTAQSLAGYSPGRPEGDFYPTPPRATIALLDAHMAVSTQRKNYN